MSMTVATDPIEEIRERWRAKPFSPMYASTTPYPDGWTAQTIITASLLDAVRDIPVLLAEIDRLNGRPA